jgi:NitT/TauT family transport system substrate-binding protein
MRAVKTIVGMLAVAVLTSSVAHAQGGKIVLGYTGANDFLAAFVAKDKGFFEKRGLDVTLTRVANGSTIPPAMIGGSITVGGITPPLFMQADDNGLGLKILATASLQSSKNPTASVVVRNGVNINSPADFVGKRVGAPGLNSVMHAMFVRWLRAKNVDPSKVTFVEAAFPQFADLLKAGQIDAALPVEPFRSRIEQANIGKVFANFFTDIRDNALFSFYAVTGDWAAKNEKQAHAFRDALNEGLEYIRSNTEDAKKSQAAHLGLPPEVVSTLPLATYETKVDPQEVQFWVQLSVDLGIISKPLELKDLIVQ